MDFLMEHIMGGGLRNVNTVGLNCGLSNEDAQFEAMYNVHVQFSLTQVGGSCLIYGRQDRIQYWNKDSNDGWKH